MDKIAVVTGAAGGMGRAIVAQLMKDGFLVVGLDLDAESLKEMEADGLVRRNDYGEIPPRVDYTLTDRGLSLRPVLHEMELWAKRNAAGLG